MAVIALQGSENVKTSKDLDGFDKILPGRYHAVIDNVDDTFMSKGAEKAVIFTFKIVAGTEASEIGKTQKEFLTVFYDTPDAAAKGIKHPTKLALVTGLITPAQLGQPLSVDFSAARGRQLVIEIAKHSYKNRDGVQVETTRIPFAGFHSVFVMDETLKPQVSNGKYLL